MWGANERWQCTWVDEKRNANNSNQAFTFGTVGDINSTVTIQSGIDAEQRDPDENTGANAEFIARLDVCVDGLVGTEDCKLYPDGNIKPIGILQTYGDSGLINFGLMTGSYQNNIEGGVLRKNPGPFTDEVAVTTDGSFIFADNDDSIVKTLEKLRAYGIQFNGNNGNTYFGNGSGDDCRFQLDDIPNGDCNFWGNPISEIYKETVRYLAGLNPDPNFQANDNSFISGLTTASFVDPLTDENQCTDLSTIVINASVSSYDDNDIDITGVPGGINGSNITAGAGTTDTWTDMVGAVEGINGNQFFIGRTGADTDEFCTAKQINSLSDAFGLCPEAPTVDGSFAMAGIAYYAHNNDLRADLDGNQTLDTFAISLATNTPVITVPRTDGGQEITILPAYRLLEIGNGDPRDGGGALVDFKIVQPHQRIGNTNTFSASYYVNWEDSEQGGDYDQDMWGLIDYVLDETSDEITITTTAVAESTGGGQLFGFVTSGTTEDGFHAYSGIAGADFTSPFANVPGCTNCRAISELPDNVNNINGNGGGDGIRELNANTQAGPESHTFSIAPNNTENLESPLYYAAKFGGFTENTPEDNLINGVTGPAPDEIDEWDAINNITGVPGPDGQPDNFFLVINPETLFDSLERSLLRILEQQDRSSSSIANFTNANGFANIIVQASYTELQTDADLNEVTWSGNFNSHFIDDFGFFREDTNGNAELDDYNIDLAFEYAFNETTEEVTVQYLTPVLDANGAPEFDDGILQLTLLGAEQSTDSINFLWEADEELSSYNNNGIVDQRIYNSAASTTGPSRYIFTFLDNDNDGNVDNGEQVDLVSGNVSPTNFQLFGVATEQIAEDVIDFTRGFDDPNSSVFRNRRLNPGTTDERVFRLGDIVNSSPVVVAEPTQNYDSVFGDTSYTAFRELYEDRRAMAYIGANDGLLHAFNAGFQEDFVSPVTNQLSVRYLEQPTGGTATPHNLGAEIWAYAPGNLLPHLQWLTSNFYSHVFYVDGDPQVFEAKIFPDDAVHPGGWGTILVVGMRLGGGDFPLILANGDADTARSAYIVMDITDPEREPTLLAEITHPDLNFTTSQPTLYYDCANNCTVGGDPSTIFDGEWLLAFGSGPNDLRTFETSETAKVFTYNLETNTVAGLDMDEVLISGNPVERSFVGGLATRDWDLGEPGFRNDDVIYFGTVGTESATAAVSGTDGDDLIETGALYRFRPSANDSFSLLFDADRPIGSAPLPLSNEEIGANVLGSWVFFGTGIYQKQDDDFIADTERLYGIIEPVDQAALNNLGNATFDPTRENSELLTYNTVLEGDLVDVTTVEVFNVDDSSLTGIIPAGVETGDLVTPVTVGATTANNFNQLRQLIVENTSGWFRELPQPIINGDPTARLATDLVFVQNFLFFTTFTPSSLNRDNICIGGEGSSMFFALNQTTGTTDGFSATLGVDSSGRAINSIDLGRGLADTSALFDTEAGGGEGIIAIAPNGDGSAQRIDPNGDGSPLQIGNSRTIRSGWREILQ